jgi:hypothetical protein
MELEKEQVSATRWVAHVHVWQSKIPPYYEPPNSGKKFITILKLFDE